ncbi:MAG: hypothetical protein IEMM0008_0129 [bacterium]|nr:MAG: hypothetical protein IEMM0008_0129 [bacterium]
MYKIFVVILSISIITACDKKENHSHDKIVTMGAGLIKKKSNHSVDETLTRLEKKLMELDFIVLPRFKHQVGAKKRANIELRPTELLLFGKPKVGTHFFTSNQTAGIDLPMKVLAWKDKKGDVWIAYNDPQYIADRHGIKDRDKIIKKMTETLDKLTNYAIKK